MGFWLAVSNLIACSAPTDVVEQDEGASVGEQELPLAGASSAPPAAKPCGPGARSVVVNGMQLCIYDGMKVPKAASLEPYCHWAELGYIGFDWSLAEVPASQYTCPKGSWYSTNNAGLGFCIFNVSTMPSEASAVVPHCENLKRGSIGYTYPTPELEAKCAPHSAASAQDGIDTCTYKHLAVPKAASLQPYCNWVKLGYIGFYWDLAEVDAASYSCPKGSWYSTNNAGQGFCIFNVNPSPADAATLTASCEQLASGTISYSFADKAKP